MDLAQIGATPKGGVLPPRAHRPRPARHASSSSAGRARRAARCASTRSATSSCGAPAGRPSCPRWRPAAISIRSPPAASSTATTASSPASRCCARSTTPASQTEAPSTSRVWTNEEGSRFVPVMMGSGVYAGAFTLEHALSPARPRRHQRAASARRDRLRRQRPPRSPTARRASTRISRRTSSRVRCSSDADKTIGVVTGALGPALVRRHRHGHGSARGADADGRCAAMRCSGAADGHAGGDRHRAAPGAPTAAARSAGCDVFPNSRNVIPGRVRFIGRLAPRRRRGICWRWMRELRDAVAAIAARPQARSRGRAGRLLPAAPLSTRACVGAVRGGARRAALPPRHRERRRPRRGLRRARRARRDDLRALQGRHQPQRDRGRASPSTSRRAPTCCCTRCSKPRAWRSACEGWSRGR